MDWPLAISRNRDALRAIIAALFALAGLALPRKRDVSVAPTERGLPRRIIAAILLILRPAESAVRRLIHLVALCGKPASMPFTRCAADAACLARLAALPKLSANFRMPAFSLFDTLKSFDPDEIWNADPAAQIRFESGFDNGLDPFFGFRVLPDQQQLVPTAGILKRLFAVGYALEDLPSQARRFMRWQAKRDALLKAGHPTRTSPMRPGLPPGWRHRNVHEIDVVLKECHRLALDLLHANTS